ncbi:hypothetical protein F5Y05DRAFT_421007 [Hypoxylon sp. FL0543]|nr:hypothetical protein F5Y05DRAFT_421007 [Hypoxylon sp. FL0543]
MRDEHENDHHEPRQIDMPYISIPTETVRTHGVRPDEQPPSVTTSSFLGTSGYLLGIDTCGFTTSSTITCDFGYECTNVGNNRGCCLPGDYDCVSTIYTDCIDYGQAPNAGACGDHTLCCSDSKPYCFTYAFSTDKDPGATFTYVECNPSDGFGEMFPFPPELMTATSTTDTASPSSSSCQSPPPHSSNSAGAIIGGVIGGVIFVILIIIAASLLFRYRQRRRQAGVRAAGISAPIQTPHSSTEISPTAEKEQAQAVAVAAAAKNGKANRRSLLRPPSLIREHPTPIPNAPITAASSTSPARYKHKSAAAAAPARQSFGPNWPLGPEPGSNPLGAHPIDANLKKRLSDSRLAARGPALGRSISSSEKPPRVPVLHLAPPGTRRPAPKSPRSPGSAPASAGAALQSPKLDWVPVSPILSVVFGDVDEKGNRRSVNGADGGPGLPTNTNVGDVDREPVSPIESDEDGVEEDMQRLSYVSAYHAGDDLVSPVSPRELESEGEGVGVTVSPLESRRESVDS